MAHTVLIVDDSKLARLVLAKAIAAGRPEWQRLEAANAAEALEIVRSQAVDIVLLDFNMPGQDGLELAAELRLLSPDMPIAVVSANIQEEVIARARQVNAAFLAKPLSDEALAGFLAGAALRLRKATR
jgi:CheY-like chemotaxis protein